jgi:glycosyltransferase involved in cell wall biosynthesis
VIAFVVNGDEQSAVADRARAFAAHLAGQWPVEILYRTRGRVASIAPITSALWSARPEAAWVFDMAVAGVLAAASARPTGTKLIIDTGDAITALARQGGPRGPVGVALTAGLEWLSPRMAHALVVRGTEHRALFAERGFDATVIPDGVDVDAFASLPDARDLRRDLGLGDALVVGLVGSSVWSPRLGIAYGWDLVEALGLLSGEPVAGLLIGDGSGIPRLEARAKELGVADRIRFVGRQPRTALPRYLAACDVCLSTQTNDLVGRVRTTGKLPLYMAAGRFVLASGVGEAVRVLPRDMLVPYDGSVDTAYPARLAERIRALVRDRTLLDAARALPAVARREFDYAVLARRVDLVIGRVTGRQRVGATA